MNRYFTAVADDGRKFELVAELLLQEGVFADMRTYTVGGCITVSTADGEWVRPDAGRFVIYPVLGEPIIVSCPELAAWPESDEFKEAAKFKITGSLV